MRRLPLVVVVLALPAAAQEPAFEADAGAPIEADAGAVIETDAGVPPADAGVLPYDAGQPHGRHFAFTWDTAVPPPGGTDVQVWLTPRWGRVDPYTAVDVRAGMMQGICKGFAFALFLDASPTATGEKQVPAVDAHVTALAHVRLSLGNRAGIAAQPSVSGGLKSLALQLLLAFDADAGPMHFAVNADLGHDIGYEKPPTPSTRARQGAAFAYVLSNGFSVGFEVQNHLTWHRGEFRGMAFLIGPAVSLRTQRFWFALTLLPQVAAVKAEANQAVGDPLELTDNERFSVRLSLGGLSL